MFNWHIPLDLPKYGHWQQLTSALPFKSIGKFTATIATALTYPETPEEKSLIIITNFTILEIFKDILFIFVGIIP